MIGKLNHRVEAFLYRRGFRQIETRQLMRNQFYLAGGVSLVLLLVSGFSAWAFSFAAGALLVTVNFYALAKVVQELVHLRKGAVVPLLVQFYGRLILTGVALYVLIAVLNAPVSALVVGLGTAVVNAMVWGAAYAVGQKVKEA